MSVLITGSVAYDTIMVYPGHFKNEILPDKVHMLNVSFLVPKMRREFGGCAGNIAYNLKLLGGEGYPLATVGEDFEDYAHWMDQHGVSRDHVKVVPQTLTAHGHVVTDLDDNQIWAFHPGAMAQCHSQSVPTAGIRYGTVSPDGREGMLLHAQQFANAGIPFLFDPGQGMPLFDAEELSHFLDLAHYCALNDYELEMFMSRTGLTIKEIASRVEALIITHGGKGSQIHTAKGIVDIPCAKAESLADPTGCGDAYRAGLLYGLLEGKDWETSGRIASLMGAIKIERPGTQNHQFTLEQFKARFKREFRYDFG